MAGLVMTVGNPLMGDDGAGPLLARLMEARRIPGWDVIDCGPVPENYVHRARALRPDVIVVVDACEMGLEPGSIRLVAEDDIAGDLFLSTHRLPLSFVLGALRELAPEVYLVGIQPSVVAFGRQISPEVRAAVEAVYRSLQAGKPDFPYLE